jgi:hypothetical protein
MGSLLESHFDLPFIIPALKRGEELNLLLIDSAGDQFNY